MLVKLEYLNKIKKRIIELFGNKNDDELFICLLIFSLFLSGSILSIKIIFIYKYNYLGNYFNIIE